MRKFFRPTQKYLPKFGVQAGLLGGFQCVDLARKVLRTKGFENWRIRRHKACSSRRREFGRKKVILSPEIHVEVPPFQLRYTYF